MEKVQKIGTDSQSLPARVRETAAWVASQADFVRVNEDRIGAYAADILSKYPLITGLDPEHHFLSQTSPVATASFVLALDSVNFGSGYFPDVQKLGVEFEYNHVASSLKKAFAESRLNTPEKWLAAMPPECHEVFGVPQKLDPVVDEFIRLFALHLQVTARKLNERHGGSVMQLLDDAGNSAVRLAELVSDWPTFRDVSFYKGREVPFFKRAQILAADLFLAFKGETPAAFGDMEGLTNFPDNMVPHVLRCDGILEYAPALAEKIENRVYLAAGSEEEVELRACGIYAVELMKQAAKKAGHDVTSVNIDHILWNRGYESGFHEKPTHLTRSVWY